jgi:hypothetical protein
MGKKINLTEAELRKMIYEAIDNVINPTNPPETKQNQSTSDAVLPRLVSDEQTNAKLNNSIESINVAKNSLGNLLSMPGQYHGLSDDIMRRIKEGTSHLDMAAQIFTQILNR